MRVDENETQTIAVLFTRYSNIFSNCIYWLSGKGYTHASIALADDSEYYYSFNFKGNKKEYYKNKKCRESIIYKLEIPQEDVTKMAAKIKELELKKEQLTYARLSLLLSIIKIPFKSKNSYFCSQFVAEILQISRQISLEKKAIFYLPNQLEMELSQQKMIKAAIKDPI